MAGDPSNVSLWAEADVLIYQQPTLLSADIPTAVTDPFATTVAWTPAGPTVKWGFLGLLSGDQGFDDARTWTEKDIDAWGYGAIMVASKDFKLETKCSYLEDNPVTTSIAWPGSAAGSIVVPQPAYYYTAFEKRTATGGIHRRITSRPARLWVQNMKDVEGDATPREISIRIFPDSNFNLFTTQDSDSDID
jgi:hypothetical protein